jgi:hypothetical protein
MRPSRMLVLSLSVMSILFLAGCGMIISGDSKLTLDTLPKDVRVTLIADNLGTKITDMTPCTVNLDRGSDYTVILEYEGFKSEEIKITRGVNGWFWGNPVPGAIIGAVAIGKNGDLFAGSFAAATIACMLVDGVTSSMWEHNVHYIKKEMAKAQQTNKVPDSLTIEYPFTFISANGGRITEYRPVRFYRKS